MQALVHRVGWAEKPGIVYAGTRKAAEEIMRLLADEGINTVFYHAGLNFKEREFIQRQFMSGAVDVIVATNAFGMCVDKADVRFVYHYDVSEPLDAYYQEIGRAGRDGQPDEAILFYRPENIGVQKYRTSSGKVETGQVAKVAEVIAIGIGGSLATPPLPHHRTCGSAYGGSVT